MIPFCSIRRLGDEVSLFLQPPLLVITLPQAGKRKMWGPQGRRARFDTVLVLTAILTKQKSNQQSDSKDRGEIRSN